MTLASAFNDEHSDVEMSRALGHEESKEKTIVALQLQLLRADFIRSRGNFVVTLFTMPYT